MAEAIESGAHPIIGVNTFREEEGEVKIQIFKHAEDMQASRIAYIKEYKKNRDQEAVIRVLDRLYELCKDKPESNLFEPIMAAVEAKATIQEICDALRKSADFMIPS